MIHIQNVSFSYDDGESNLEKIQLAAAPGECILLCGASGCGKTTITKLVNGLIPHFEEGHLEGRAVVAHMVVGDTPLYQLSQKVGSVFQNPKSQFFNIDSDSELAFGLENCGTAPDLIRSRVDTVTKELEIQHLLHRNVFSMSGGEKQSLAFASVYAMNPQVYVLDEPSANLDTAATQHLRNQIKAIKAQGKTILIAEHRLYYLADLIDRAVYIESGRIRNIYTREAFLALSENERHSLGLRTIQPPEQKVIAPPPVSGALEIRDLTVKYKKETVISHLSFSASKGKVLGIVGHNGAGKSTLMRCIAGLIKPASGQILFEGKPLKEKARNKLCYMIMQDVNHQLFGDSVWNECTLSRGEEGHEEEITQALKAYDLLEFRDKHPMSLSGGQKQRLAIATGVAAGKEVLLFDEPTSGLDYSHMKAVSKTLRDLSHAGHVVIVITHDQELINDTCDQILDLNHLPRKECSL